MVVREQQKAYIYRRSAANPSPRATSLTLSIATRIA
jgi:hypothetical protein